MPLFSIIYANTNEVEKLSQVALELACGTPIDCEFIHNRWTPLGIAIKTKQLLLAELLLAHGARLTRLNSFGFTALQVACEFNQLAMVKLLLPYCQELINKPIEQSYYDRELGYIAAGRTPLHAAVLHGNQELVQLLLSQGANKEALDEAGRTPWQLLEHLAFVLRWQPDKLFALVGSRKIDKAAVLALAAEPELLPKIKARL